MVRKSREILITSFLLLLTVIVIFYCNRSPQYNLLPIKYGSVKPPLYYSNFFDNHTITVSSCTLNGTFETKIIPLMESQEADKPGLVFKSKHEYIVLSDRDTPVYEPIDYSTLVGWKPLSSYNNSLLYIEGYKFNQTINGVLYRFLRPYWIGDKNQYCLVEKSRHILSTELGEDYTRKYFTVFPAYYGYQVYNNPKSDWNYAVMFCYEIRVDEFYSQNEVTVYFDSKQEFVKIDRLPPIDNLQPYSVSQVEAVNIAVKHGLPRNAYCYESRIYYTGKIHGVLSDVPLNRYVWVVTAWRSTPYVDGAKGVTYFVDPKNGNVYGHEEFEINVMS